MADVDLIVMQSACQSVEWGEWRAMTRQQIVVLMTLVRVQREEDWGLLNVEDESKPMVEEVEEIEAEETLKMRCAVEWHKPVE